MEDNENVTAYQSKFWNPVLASFRIPQDRTIFVRHSDDSKILMCQQRQTRNATGQEIPNATLVSHKKVWHSGTDHSSVCVGGGAKQRSRPTRTTVCSDTSRLSSKAAKQKTGGHSLAEKRRHERPRNVVPWFSAKNNRSEVQPLEIRQFKHQTLIPTQVLQRNVVS